MCHASRLLPVFNANHSKVVRIGSLADILTSPHHVRFTPNNGLVGRHIQVSIWLCA